MMMSRLKVDELMDAKEVAAFFGVHPQTIHAWGRRPELYFPKPIVIGVNRKFWTRRQLDDWFKMRNNFQA